jgi:fructose-1-phosphate kinase PfkB-like protein
VPYRDAQLYFRGSLITRAHLKWIDQKYTNFKAAEQVVVTGSAAGGVAAYLWSEYIAKLVKNGQSVVQCISDSAFLLQFKTYATNDSYIMTLIQYNFQLANIDEKTPLSSCNGIHVHE